LPVVWEKNVRKQRGDFFDSHCRLKPDTHYRFARELFLTARRPTHCPYRRPSKIPKFQNSKQCLFLSILKPTHRT